MSLLRRTAAASASPWPPRSRTRPVRSSPCASSSTIPSARSRSSHPRRSRRALDAQTRTFERILDARTDSPFSWRESSVRARARRLFSDHRRRRRHRRRPRPSHARTTGRLAPLASRETSRANDDVDAPSTFASSRASRARVSRARARRERPSRVRRSACRSRARRGQTTRDGRGRMWRRRRHSPARCLGRDARATSVLLATGG